MIYIRTKGAGVFKATSSSIQELETFFCLLSGENPTLPLAEAEAILESEQHQFMILLRLPRVLQLRSTANGIEAIGRRAAYSRLCCREVFSCEGDMDQMQDSIDDSQYEKFLNRGDTFRVEFMKVEPKAPFKGEEFKKRIGRAILDSVPGTRVNLSRSDRTFVGVATEKLLFFGSVVGHRDCGLAARKPHLRPYFHPSAMSTKLARCMVNLSRARPGSVFLDAFCGTGSHLQEAALTGCTVLGSDISLKMVRGTLQNLCFSDIRGYHLCLADAKALPFKAFDSCASDPPYGRGSSTHGMKPVEVVREFLEDVFQFLVSGNHICLAFPEYGDIGALGKAIGYKVRESHLVREHKNLTREIVVLRRP